MGNERYRGVAEIPKDRIALLRVRIRDACVIEA